MKLLKVEYFNNVKYSRLILNVLSLFFIAFVGYFVAFANEESGDSDNFFLQIIVAIIVFIFKVIALPGLLIFQKFGVFFYILGVVIDCVIYGFIVELLIVKFRSRPK
jgi:ABC-type glycerol-3-phosphate transport system permease component